MRKAPSILIVEDEMAVAELIATNLRHCGFQPIWAKDSATAQAAVDAALPDLILLDLTLPGDSGLTLARGWRADAKTRRVPIIMLTARGDEDDRVAGLDAGADDYMTKPFSTRELLARIRALLRRYATGNDEHVLSIADLSLNTATHRVMFRDEAVKLGPTEFKLLLFLMTCPERVHTRSQLLANVWGDYVLIDERTVDVHVKRLRGALGQVAGAMVETVRGAGYRITDQVPSLLH
jgi:two-component system phosphate regulon response regulator PhoB